MVGFRVNYELVKHRMNTLKKIFFVLVVVLGLFVFVDAVEGIVCQPGSGNEGQPCCVVGGDGRWCPENADIVTDCQCNSGFKCVFKPGTNEGMCTEDLEDEECGYMHQPCCPGEEHLYCKLSTTLVCDPDTSTCVRCGLENDYCCIQGDECRRDDLKCVQSGAFRRCISEDDPVEDHICDSVGDFCCSDIGDGSIRRCHAITSNPYCYCDGGLVPNFRTTGCRCEVQGTIPDDDNGNGPGWDNPDWPGPIGGPPEPPPEFEGNVAGMVDTIIGYLFPIAGLIALFFIIQGGYMWIVSAGDPNRVKQAQGTLTWAIIGLVVVMVIFGVIRVILNFLS